MSKVYTAQEMREFAKLYYARGKTIREVCARRGGAVMFTVFPSEGVSDRKVASMLLQAADSLEREAAKDAEIGKLRECLREAVEWSCGNPDDACGDCVAHGGDTPCKCETWRKMLEGLLKASTVECASCDYECGPNRENCIIREAEQYIKEGVQDGK